MIRFDVMFGDFAVSCVVLEYVGLEEAIVDLVNGITYNIILVE